MVGRPFLELWTHVVEDKTAFSVEMSLLERIILQVESHEADDYLDFLIGGRIPSQSSPLLGR